MDVVAHAFVTIASIACLLPFLYVVSVSLTNPDSYVPYKFYFFPKQFSFDVYKYILGTDSFLNALKSTLFITVIGTVLNLIITFTFAYSVTKKELPFRKPVMGLVIFALLFNAGIIPNYWLVKELGLINSYWSCILPVLTNSWSIIIAKSFLQNLPSEIEDSALMDGCSYFDIFFKIVIPLSMASIASLALFFAVGHWNVYIKPTMYLTDHTKRTLQVYVKMLLVDAAEDQGALMEGDKAAPPTETVRLATVVLAMLPILCVYPFVQRYFIKGVMLGSVKG